MADLCNSLSIARANRLYAPKIVQANCVASDAIGDCIISSGSRISGLYQVTKIDPRIVTSGPSWGIIVSKSSSTFCTVQMFGILDGVYTGLVVGKIQWVGLNGKLHDDNSTITPLPAGKVFVQQMGLAISSDVVLLSPEQPIVRNG